MKEVCISQGSAVEIKSSDNEQTHVQYCDSPWRSKRTV